jgi:25S rRNA (uracil2634-N3)-methyltransferase
VFGKDKKEEEKPKEDKRTTQEKQKDLDTAVKEGTSFLKEGGHDKKEIDEKLTQLRTAYNLVDLRIVVDKDNNNGADIVHVHGEVNPRLDSEKFELLTPEDLKPSEGNRILLLGEANFSFSLSLAKTIGGTGITATSYESEEKIKTQKRKAGENISKLKNEGVKVEHGIDATNLSYKPNSFQNVVFNFPYVPETSRGGTANTKAMLNGFFGNVSNILQSGGKVFLALPKEYHIDRYKPEQMANKNNLSLESYRNFDSSLFPGYIHSMTTKDKSAGSVIDEEGVSRGIVLIFKKK